MRGHSLADCRLAEAIVASLQPRSEPAAAADPSRPDAAVPPHQQQQQAGAGGSKPEAPVKAAAEQRSRQPLISQCQAADVDALTPSELLEMVAWAAACSSTSGTASIGAAGGAWAVAASRNEPRHRRPRDARGDRSCPRRPDGGDEAAAGATGAAAAAGPSRPAPAAAESDYQDRSAHGGTYGISRYQIAASGMLPVEGHGADQVDEMLFPQDEDADGVGEMVPFVRPSNVEEYHVSPFGFGPTATSGQSAAGGPGGAAVFNSSGGYGARAAGGAAGSRSGFGGPSGRGASERYRGGGATGRGDGEHRGNGVKRHRGALCPEQRHDVRLRLHERLMTGALDGSWLQATHAAWRCCLRRVMADAQSRRLVSEQEAAATAAAAAAKEAAPAAARRTPTASTPTTPVGDSSMEAQMPCTNLIVTGDGAGSSYNPWGSHLPIVGQVQLAAEARGSVDAMATSIALIETLLGVAAEWCVSNRCVTVGTMTILRQVRAQGF